MKKASESRKTDRIVVIVSAVIGLSLAVWAILQVNGFNDRFKPPQAADESRGKELLEQAAARVDLTRQAVSVAGNSEPSVWNIAQVDGRDRGFLVSTGLVFRRGVDVSSDTIVNMDNEDPVLRPPFPNSYVTRFGLQLEFANVGDLDPDKDFFTTLEEFEFSKKLGQEFSPIDPKSHPPMFYKLRYARFEEVPYRLKFTSPNPPSFGLRYETDNKEDRWTMSAELGEDTNGNGVLDEGEDTNLNGVLDKPVAAGKKNDVGRFLVLKYRTEKVRVGDFEENVIIATFEDTFRAPSHPQRKFELAEGKDINLPVRQAVFEFLPTPGTIIQKKEFEKFPLPGTEQPSFLLIQLEEEKAVLQFEENGQTKKIELPKGQIPVPIE